MLLATNGEINGKCRFSTPGDLRLVSGKESSEGSYLKDIILVLMSGMKEDGTKLREVARSSVERLLSGRGMRQDTEGRVFGRKL